MYVAEYFMRGQRGQWAGEGYIVSILVILAGFTFIGLSKVDILVQGSFNKRMAICGGVLTAYILIQLILTCYMFKSPWYGPTFMPPGHYLRGPLNVDQGNNIWDIDDKQHGI